MSTTESRTLDNGLILTLTDLSNRYFGDYHRVCLEVCCTVPVQLPDPAAEAEARRLLGETVVYRRRLEQMAVPSVELEAVRAALLQRFDEIVARYIDRPDFPERFVRQQLAQARRTSASY